MATSPYATQGVNALLQRTTPQNYGIDFLATARGQEIGNAQNLQDQLRAQQEQQIAAQRQQWETIGANQEAQRIAGQYASSILRNSQIAADQGISPADFLIQQRAAVLADPNFQQFSPEVQNAVISKLGQSARARVQDLYRTGSLDAANRLAAAYGFVEPVSQVEIAASAGDPQGILAAINSQYGANFQLNPDGQTVNIGGTNVPLNDLAYRLAQSGGRGAAGLATAIETRQAQDRAAEQQALFDRVNGGGMNGTGTPEMNALAGAYGTNLQTQDSTIPPVASQGTTRTAGTAGVQPQSTLPDTPIGQAIGQLETDIGLLDEQLLQLERFDPTNPLRIQFAQELAQLRERRNALYRYMEDEPAAAYQVPETATQLLGSGTTTLNQNLMNEAQRLQEEINQLGAEQETLLQSPSTRAQAITVAQRRSRLEAQLRNLNALIGGQ